MPTNESGTITLKRSHIATGIVKEILVWDEIQLYIGELLEKVPDFTGRLEINFKDGILMDINETKRTKF